MLHRVISPGGRHDIVALAGDGIGPEVTDAALAVLEAACTAGGIDVRVESRWVGGAAIEHEGAPISTATFARCREATAVLFGATGAPRWDHLSGDARPGSALIRLRRALGLCINLRPVRVHPGLEARTSLRPEVVAGCDLVVVRELAGGIYYGDHGRSGDGPEERAFDTMVYTRLEIERVARAAFELAMRRSGRLISVDKANVLSSGRLWRDTVSSLADEYPQVTLSHALVDSFALRLVQRPRDLDVIVTENLLGDILSDEAAALSGSIGLLPSASLPAGAFSVSAGPPPRAVAFGLYEPVHGSAPDIAGANVANPVGAVLSVALLLEISLGRADVAERVRAAVEATIASGRLTGDLGGAAGTTDITRAVLTHLQD